MIEDVYPNAKQAQVGANKPLVANLSSALLKKQQEKMNRVYEKSISQSLKNLDVEE